MDCTDPKFRAGVDGFSTVSNGDYADPAGLLAEVDLPGGLMNFDINDPAINSSLEQARITAAAIFSPWADNLGGTG